MGGRARQGSAGLDQGSKMYCGRIDCTAKESAVTTLALAHALNRETQSLCICTQKRFGLMMQIIKRAHVAQGGEVQ